jgi:uncharacterized protein YhaN
VKLAEIQIERCGIWRDLTLSLNPRGLNVLYGPNEAGKSTLLRFVQGVLYGFSTRIEGSPRDRAPSGPTEGSLLLEGESGPRRVRRSAAAGTRGVATLIGEGQAAPASEMLADALQGIDEQAFRALFAIDLRQLQELGVLTGDEAAARLYDVSLGPDGRRLLEASRLADLGRKRFIDPLQQDGELVRLFEQHDQLEAQLHEVDRRRQHYDARCAERDRLEKDLADLERRHAGIREQLRGHLYLERAWGPWQQLRTGRQELDELPVVVDFPERGLERLERLETDIASAAEARDRSLSAVKRCRRLLEDSAINNPLFSQAGIAQGFVEQRGWIAQLEERRESAKGECQAAETIAAAALARLGPDWTAEGLLALDPSPAGWQKLSGTAHSQLQATARRQVLRRKCRRLSARFRELRDSLTECLHDLGDQSVDAALAEAREKLRQMNHLARLQVREAELNERQFSLVEHRERIAPQLTLPRWVHVVLGVFSFMGIILGGWGLIAGIVTSGIAGAIYAMLGITCGGLAWGLKAQYEGDARRRIDEADSQLASALTELRDVRGSIAGLTGESPARADSAPAPVDGGDLVRRAAERVAELVDLAQHQRNLRSLRRRLDETRQKRDGACRELETVRQTWHDLLSQLQLPETLPPGRVLEIWQLLLEARAAQARLAQARESYATVDHLWNSCRDRIAEFGRRLSAWEADYDRPLVVLETWAGELAALNRARKERRALKVEIRAHRREASAHQARVNELKLERDALLVQGGAAARDEFELRAGYAARRTYLEDQSADSQADLDAIGGEYSDLAIVEDDLLSYDAQSNSECIETLKLENADLERDLLLGREKLAGVAHQIREMEDDRRATGLRFELEQVRQQLRQAARDWAVVELAAQAGDDLRHEFERRHQPAALLSASRYFSRLTQGRYPSVWSPLGEARLMVDDDEGNSLPVSTLSRGTREQLFLAARLAAVEELSRKGVSLPMILDDVFVNFDERRAEAAAEVLCEFTQAGHQVLLLTCHIHLARTLQSKGIEPIWLPEHRTDHLDRDAQRRAG